MKERLYSSRNLETDIEISALMILEQYQQTATQYGINVFNPLSNSPLQEIKLACESNKPTRINNKSIPPLTKIEGIPEELKSSQDSRLKSAALLYHKLIKPLLATGKDAFKPTPQDIVELCQFLAFGNPTFIMYYAFSKTQSPIRTNSPNNIIDFAELEMLRYWSQLILTAQELGFNLQLLIIDEAFELPKDEFLGFSYIEQETNLSIGSNYLKKILPNGGITIKPLSESVRTPLGNDFKDLYARLYPEILKTVINSLSSDEWNSYSIRMRVFLECMAPEIWNRYNINQILNNLNSPRDLLEIPQKLLEYIIKTTTHFNTIMTLRNEAAERTQKDLNYPEYNSDNRVYGGVTRNGKRWSFLPHPTRWQGQTVNPMHGIAVYSTDGEYRGNVPFYKIPLDSQLIKLGDKPLFVII